MQHQIEVSYVHSKWVTIENEFCTHGKSKFFAIKTLIHRLIDIDKDQDQLSRVIESNRER